MRLFFLMLALVLAVSPAIGETPSTGPGWRMELVAQAPQINHPSVVCSAPDGRIFIAEDPMDIRTAHADAMEGRILCIHPDGHTTVFADKLHAVFGMQYLEGKLYVLHNPKFSVFTDDNGVGKERVDLIEQTNPNPWALDWNDHVPANFRLGMDGYFYVAVGDKGVFGAVGRDGSRVDLHGGGILRLRPDGTKLEVFARGVRNIMEVALNAEDELFTYDNTDEHDWMGRLTHMVEGGSYGYPHDFIPRRPYTLWMMHDFGGGAATGVECYTGDALPTEYRGNLFLADFGKRQVLRVQIEREGATYRVVKHSEMFPNPPEDFRPVGIAWSGDQRSLLICDWQHRDTKEDVKVGRLWKLTFTNAFQTSPRPVWFQAAASGQPFRASDDELIRALEHPSRDVRLTAQRRLAEQQSTPLQITLAKLLKDGTASSAARQHALWALDGIDGGRSSRKAILELVASEPDLPVRRQAIRQVGLRRVPEAVAPLAVLAGNSAAESSLRFHAATALGRIGDPSAIPALSNALDQADVFGRYAAFSALNSIGRAHPESWKTIAEGLGSTNERVREGTAFALRETEDAQLVRVLGSIAGSAPDATTRESALRLLVPLHHSLAPWNGEWWAYHPALTPPPKRTVEWAGTRPVIDTLTAALADPSLRVRVAAVEGIEVAGHQAAAPQLVALFGRESDSNARRAVLRTLTTLKDTNATALVIGLLREPPPDLELVREAIRSATALSGSDYGEGLVQLVRSHHAAGAEAVAALGALHYEKSVPALAEALADLDASVRLAAIRSLGEIKGAEAFTALRRVANSESVPERRALARALGGWSTPDPVPWLLELWRDPETRGNALEALAAHGDIRALDAYLDGLASANPSVREQCRKALTGIRDAVLHLLESRAATLAPVVVAELREVYREQAGVLKGPLFASENRVPSVEDYAAFALKNAGDSRNGQRLFWDDSGVACIKCHQVGGAGAQVGPDLTLIGAQFPRRELIEHVLEPSKVVREGYQQFFIEARDGESWAGLIKSESADALTIIDGAGQLRSLPKKDITSRTASALSLMPEGLHAGLSLEQFADLIAFLETRRADPRLPENRSVPEGFEPLFNGHNLDGWREFPAGTKRVDEAALRLGRPPEHWFAKDGVLEHDGLTGDLWSEREFGDFDLALEWRWADSPKWESFPLINSEGLEASPDGHAATARVLDAGDSGVLLRGLYKAQANLFCYPVGSGEFWEYRTDPNSTVVQRRAFTPKENADRPIGDWNSMEVRLRSARVSVRVNGDAVITDAELPGLPTRGPIGLQHEHGRIQFRNLFLREANASR
jgi:putative membrane-bound dehydrogenase-like protein